MKQDQEIGLYVAAHQTFYMIKSTRWTNPHLSIDRLRKILMAKGLLSFTGPLISGQDKEVAKFYPVQMTLKQAKDKGYKIEELVATDGEKSRIDKAAEIGETPKDSNGRFKKK